MSTNTSFPAQFRALREKSGLSIYALAKATGLSRSFLGHLERGTKAPSWETVCKIADALGIGTNAFRKSAKSKK